MKGGSTECFKLGTGLGLSVREILETAEKVTGRKIPVRYGPRREGDPPRLIANPKTAREILGWEARCKDACLLYTSFPDCLHRRRLLHRHQAQA